MTDPHIDLSLFTWIIGGLLSVLVLVLSWGVTQTQKKVDGIAGDVRRIFESVSSIERDLRGELAGLDRRVGQLHTAIKSLHPEYKGLDVQ